MPHTLAMSQGDKQVLLKAMHDGPDPNSTFWALCGLLGQVPGKIRGVREVEIGAAEGTVRVTIDHVLGFSEVLRELELRS